MFTSCQTITSEQSERLRQVVSRILGREIHANEVIDDTMLEALEHIADRLDALEHNARVL